MPKNCSMMVVLRVGLVLIDGGLLLKMWVRTSNLLMGYPLYKALMAELADAQDLKSCVHLDVRVRPSVGVYGGYRYQLTRTRDY